MNVRNKCFRYTTKKTGPLVSEPAYEKVS